MEFTRTATPLPKVNLDDLNARLARLKRADAGYDLHSTRQPVRVATQPVRPDVMHNQVVETLMGLNITDGAATSCISHGELVPKPTMNPNTSCSAIGNEVAVGINEAIENEPHNSVSMNLKVPVNNVSKGIAGVEEARVVVGVGPSEIEDMYVKSTTTQAKHAAHPDGIEGTLEHRSDESFSATNENRF